MILNGILNAIWNISMSIRNLIIIIWDSEDIKEQGLTKFFKTCLGRYFNPQTFSNHLKKRVISVYFDVNQCITVQSCDIAYTICDLCSPPIKPPPISLRINNRKMKRLLWQSSSPMSHGCCCCYCRESTFLYSFHMVGYK